MQSATATGTASRRSSSPSNETSGDSACMLGRWVSTSSVTKTRSTHNTPGGQQAVKTPFSLAAFYASGLSRSLALWSLRSSLSVCGRPAGQPSTHNLGPRAIQAAASFNNLSCGVTVTCAWAAAEPLSRCAAASPLLNSSHALCSPPWWPQPRRARRARPVPEGPACPRARRARGPGVPEGPAPAPRAHHQSSCSASRSFIRLMICASTTSPYLESRFFMWTDSRVRKRSFSRRFDMSTFDV